MTHTERLRKALEDLLSTFPYNTPYSQFITNARAALYEGTTSEEQEAKLPNPEPIPVEQPPVSKGIKSAEEVWEKWREQPSGIGEFVSQQIIPAMEEYASQFKPLAGEGVTEGEIEVRLIAMYRDGGTKVYEDRIGRKYYDCNRIGMPEYRGKITNLYPKEENMADLVVLPIKLKQVCQYDEPWPEVSRLSTPQVEQVTGKEDWVSEMNKEGVRNYIEQLTSEIESLKKDQRSPLMLNIAKRKIENLEAEIAKLKSANSELVKALERILEWSQINHHDVGEVIAEQALNT